MNKNDNAMPINMGFFYNLFWNCFLYVDTPEHLMERVKHQYNIPMHFYSKEFTSLDHKYVFCITMVRKKYTQKMIEEIFPKLHNMNMLHYGKDYLDFCSSIFNTVKLKLQVAIL